MGHAACDLLEAELALDRLDAELAAELPAHLRAFARSYADGVASPPAPAAARRAGSLAIAHRALAHPVLADRALALLRLLAPIAIEDDPRVASVRAGERTWNAFDTLRAARDAAARDRFGLGHIDLVHRLHGAREPAGDAAWPEPIEGWLSPWQPIAMPQIERAWRDLAATHGVRGRCQIVQAPEARPRAFVIDPEAEVTIVIGTLDTPAARFTALHELGHAVAALVAGALPRVVDEAAAAYVARLLEAEGVLDLAWFTPLAERARARRRKLAAALDAVERGGGTRPIPCPPWALWHDPGVQAAYVDAELLADRWWAELGPAPAPGALAAALTAERARIDRTTAL
jgi:hypothetical protein